MTVYKPDLKKPATHEVFNQVPPLVDYNLYTSDRALLEAVRREGASWADGRLQLFGELVGSREIIEWGFKANQYTPVLKTHDRQGNRIDEVDFHPSWYQLMDLAVKNELHCLPWREARKGAHVARAALLMLDSQNEAGHGCPISMTYSAVPALRKQPQLAAEWEPRICSIDYDKRLIPAQKKSGVIFGMAMTEKQGGSDVRANTTRAVPVNGGGPGGEYSITGHKWFCSAPMSDAFLVLAQAPGGLSCFLLPRWTPDGERNRFFIQRLKDKLGNRSNASSEVEFDSAYARLIGEEGRGVATIVEMVNHTRLDCTIVSAALMRKALSEALNHCRNRSAFGRLLIEQPLMKNVLADLCLESEACTVMMMRLARAYDESEQDQAQASFRRLATAVCKYWSCKRAPLQVVEALECHGGNGYVEESIMPRLYREAPLNSIWEGSGNVICLDVLRAMSKEPESVEAFFDEVTAAGGSDARLDKWVGGLKDKLRKPGELETQARALVEAMALALQASLLIRFAPHPVADAFCGSRLSGDWGAAFGTLAAATDFDFIIGRSWLQD